MRVQGNPIRNRNPSDELSRITEKSVLNEDLGNLACRGKTGPCGFAFNGHETKEGERRMRFIEAVHGEENNCEILFLGKKKTVIRRGELQ